jgi:hypothetical protein
MTKLAAEHVHTHSSHVVDRKGVEYEAQIFGVRRDDGTWAGWIEFHPLNYPGPFLTTGLETSQPDRNALDYWAGGIEPVYLQGALERAKQ